MEYTCCDYMVEEGMATAFKSSLMSPLDKDYIDSLVKLGYEEDAKAKLDEFYQNSKKQLDSLFSPDEKEYFEALVKGDQKEEAERALELAYKKRKDVDKDDSNRKNREQTMMMVEKV